MKRNDTCPGWWVIPAATIGAAIWVTGLCLIFG